MMHNEQTAMKQDAYTSPNAISALDQRLGAVIARARWASRGVRTGAAIWPIPVSILSAIIIDATFPLPAILRAAIAVFIVFLSIRVVLGLIPSRAARRMNTARAARIVETRSGITHNALINALQLRPIAASEGVSGELARRAVAQGEDRARAVSLKGIIDTTPIKTAWGWSLLALAAFALLWAASPRLFAMGLPRLAEPFADHPPYTRTEFDISWEPERVLAGDDATIRVALSGQLPKALDLVALDANGNAIDRAPMTAQPPPSTASPDAPATQYSAVARDLRAPYRFRVRGDTGYSRTFTITPEQRPRIEAVELRVAPPAYTDLPETVHTGSSLADDRGPIPVLLGSTVTLRARTTIGLEAIDQSGSTVTAGASVSGRDAIQQTRFDAPGERTLSLTPIAVGGLPAEQAAAARIIVVEDQPPTVRIEEPAADGEVFVLTGASFPVAGVATDDVRVARFAMACTILRDEDHTLPINHEFTIEPRRRAADARAVLNTNELGLSAGDALQLTLTATDNRAPEFGGPQTTTSNTITVRVLDREDFARRFAQELTAEQITRPYEELADAAEALDHRAQDLRAEARELARDLERMGEGGPLPEPIERAARALQERIDAFNAHRSDLADEIQQRLDAPDAVDFDAEMREPMQRLLDRLESMTAPDLPRLEDQSQQPSADNQGEQSQQSENPDAEQGDEPERQQLDRARVGQWLERAEQALQEDAQQAALAADEAQLDIDRPAAALALADQLQRTLEQVDDAARRQRSLADRLASMDQADETARDELAASQYAIQAQLEQSVRDLRTLGDRAAHELASKDSPSQLARSILDERANVQRAIDDLSSAAERLTDGDDAGLGDESVRALIDKSAALVMDEVYRQTLPVTDALEQIESMPARDDDPAAESLAPALEEIRRALRVLDQIEQYLDEARESYESAKGGSVALRSLPQALAILAIAAAPDDLSADTDAQITEALEQARFRIDRLRATLRQVELGLSPLLPTMGNSAMQLAESVVSSDAPDHMEAAASALAADDLQTAAQRALQAAEALEALYQDPGQPQPGQSTAQDIDQEMQLRKPADQQQSSESQSSPSSQSTQQPTDGHSMGSAQRPSTLDQLAQNRAQQAQDPQDTQSNADNEPPAQAGGQSGNGAAGQPQSPGEQSQEDRDGSRQRSRFFNEMLYQESDLPPEEVDGAITEGLPGQPNAQRTTSRATGDAASAAAVPRGLTAPAAAAFIHVPESYKDIVAAYFERVARESEQNRDPQ